ncbi:hypothetical protein VTN00DRAFT_5402 [Thermoascus crustaceus]|uniref:uncharacterized protein n=1 Tax=Thermoascus crustaceus TaxID=5088 RepID=UPI003742D94B
MAQLQIPTVTAEDLQAFHARHFPGQEHPPVPEFAAHTEKYDEFDEEEYDDGLGYYPDGVKRTLTDEQIRIFRHSEIHALLREKQLREEKEKEAREASENNSIQTSSGSQAREKSHGAMEAQSTSSSGKKRKAERNGNGPRVVGSRVSGGKKGIETHDETSGALDYGDDDYIAAKEQRYAPSASSHPHLAGRKIISYED